MATAFKVSWHKASSQYIKYIGVLNGRPKYWYLGSELPAALARALDLKTKWAAIKASGGRGWEDAPVECITTHQNSTGAAPVDSGSIHEAAEAYLAEYERRQEAGQISMAYARGHRQRLENALRGLKSFPDDGYAVAYEFITKSEFLEVVSNPDPTRFPTLLLEHLEMLVPLAKVIDEIVRDTKQTERKSPNEAELPYPIPAFRQRHRPSSPEALAKGSLLPSDPHSTSPSTLLAVAESHIVCRP